MKRITKLFLTVAVVLFAGSSFAQDITFGDAFNKGNEAYQAGNALEAVAQFKQALKLAQEAGDEGIEIAENCKDLIPQILLAEAGKNVAAKNYDKAEELFNDALATATEYGNADMAKSAKEKLAQIPMAKGADALNSKDFTTAIDCFKKATEQNPQNATAFYYLGAAQNSANMDADAEVSLKKAIELGNANAKGMLKNMYMVELSSANKAKNFAKVVEAAEKVNALNPDAPDAQASLFGGIAAYNAKNYTKAINLLKGAGNNANANYYLAMSYDKAGNKKQACVYFKKIVSEAKFAAFAKQKITALGC